MSDPTLREVLTPIVRALLVESGPRASMISQRNSEAALGLPSRVHLENCRRRDFTPRVLKLGKLRLVDANEYRAWLNAVERRPSVVLAEDLEDGASRILAELGLREVSKEPVDSSLAPRTKRTTARSLR